MKIKLSDTFLNCELYSEKKIQANDILLFHGFTGSARDWDFLIPSLIKDYNVFALDFLGHGSSECPDNPELYTFDSINSRLDELISKIIGQRPVILGWKNRFVIRG